jgi:hypothetical protein
MSVKKKVTVPTGRMAISPIMKTSFGAGNTELRFAAPR